MRGAGLRGWLRGKAAEGGEAGGGGGGGGGGHELVLLLCPILAAAPPLLLRLPSAMWFFCRHLPSPHRPTDRASSPAAPNDDNDHALFSLLALFHSCS